MTVKVIENTDGQHRFQPRKWVLEDDSGQFERHYEHLENPNTVSVVIRDTEGKWVCVKEFRAGAGQYMVGLVSGVMETGETPEDAAAREALEEAGYVLNMDKMVVAGPFFKSPGWTDECAYIVYAWDAVPAKDKAEQDPHENVEVMVVDVLVVGAPGNPHDLATFAAVGFATMIDQMIEGNPSARRVDLGSEEGVQWG